MDNEEPGWAYGRAPASARTPSALQVEAGAVVHGGKPVVNAFIFPDAHKKLQFDRWYGRIAPAGLRVRSRVSTPQHEVIKTEGGRVAFRTAEKLLDEMAARTAAQNPELKDAIKHMSELSGLEGDLIKSGLLGKDRPEPVKLFIASNPTGPDGSVWEDYLKKLDGKTVEERHKLLYGTFEPAPFELDPRECVVNTFNTRPRGAWSTTMDNGVRITHKPTGLMAEEGNDRSQHVNKTVAFRKLTALVAAAPAQAPTPPPFKSLEALRAWHMGQAEIQKAEDAKFTAMCYARTEPGKVTTFARIAENARALAELHLSAVHVLDEAAKG